MSWMAEMSSYRYLAELKRRYAESDAAAAHPAPAPEPEPDPDASDRADAAAGVSSNGREAARPLDTTRPSA